MTQTLRLMMDKRKLQLDNLKIFYKKQNTNYDKDLDIKGNKIMTDILIHDTEILEYLVSMNTMLRKEVDVLSSFAELKISMANW